MTPTERFIKAQADRRVRHELRLRELGLVRVNVWVPARHARKLQAAAARLRSRILASADADGD